MRVYLLGVWPHERSNLIFGQNAIKHAHLVQQAVKYAVVVRLHIPDPQVELVVGDIKHVRAGLIALEYDFVVLNTVHPVFVRVGRIVIGHREVQPLIL